MTLLITVFVAVICTIIWYRSELRSEMKIGTLCLMFWGASLMWLIDAVVEYFESGVDFFSPSPYDMLNDLFLGLSVVAFGLTALFGWQITFELPEQIWILVLMLIGIYILFYAVFFGLELIMSFFFNFI